MVGVVDDDSGPDRIGPRDVLRELLAERGQEFPGCLADPSDNRSAGEAQQAVFVEGRSASGNEFRARLGAVEQIRENLLADRRVTTRWLRRARPGRKAGAPGS